MCPQGLARPYHGKSVKQNITQANHITSSVSGCASLVTRSIKNTHIHFFKETCISYFDLCLFKVKQDWIKRCSENTYTSTPWTLTYPSTLCSCLYWPGSAEWKRGDPTALPHWKNWKRSADTGHSECFSLTGNACLFYSSVTSDQPPPKRGSTKSLFKSHRIAATFA